MGIYVRENTLKNLLLDSGFASEYGKQLEKQLGMSLKDLNKNYSNLDDNAKNLIRTYGVLYQSIERFGKATEDSFNTTTGVLLKFQAQVENTKLALGRMMVPILTIVLPLLTQALKMVEIIATKIGEVFTQIAQLMGYTVTDYKQNVNVDYDYNSNIKDGAEEDSEALKKLDTQLAGRQYRQCWLKNLINC